MTRKTFISTVCALALGLSFVGCAGSAGVQKEEAAKMPDISLKPIKLQKGAKVYIEEATPPEHVYKSFASSFENTVISKTQGSLHKVDLASKKENRYGNSYKVIGGTKENVKDVRESILNSVSIEYKDIHGLAKGTMDIKSGNERLSQSTLPYPIHFYITGDSNIEFMNYSEKIKKYCSITEEIVDYANDNYQIVNTKDIADVVIKYENIYCKRLSKPQDKNENASDYLVFRVPSSKVTATNGTNAINASSGKEDTSRLATAGTGYTIGYVAGAPFGITNSNLLGSVGFSLGFLFGGSNERSEYLNAYYVRYEKNGELIDESVIGDSGLYPEKIAKKVVDRLGK